MLKTIFSLTNIKTPMKTIGNSIFLTPETKLVFLQLRKAFIKTPILNHFDRKRYIRMKIYDFRSVIGGILSQLIPELGQ